MKYQDVGDRGDPSTDGILNKLDEIACLVAEQLFDDIHRLDNGSDLYALESNPHSQNRAELLRSGFSFECGKALREMLIHYAATSQPRRPLLASRFASLPPVCAGGYPYDKNSLMMMAPERLRPFSQGTQYFVAHGIGSVPYRGLYSLYFETQYGSGIPLCMPVRPRPSRFH